MIRTSKWVLPVVAFALLTPLVGVSARAADEAAGAKATVSGTVTGADGAAAANVRVRVMARDEAVASVQAADEGSEAKPGKGQGPKMKQVAETTTDADGKFSVEVPAGEYVVVAGQRGQGTAREKVTLQAGETKTLALTLKKGKGAGAGGKKSPAQAE